MDSSLGYSNNGEGSEHDLRLEPVRVQWPHRELTEHCPHLCGRWDVPTQQLNIIHPPVGPQRSVFVALGAFLPDCFSSGAHQ